MAVGSLKVDVDRRAANVDNTIETVVGTADGLLCAASAASNTDGGNGGAAHTDDETIHGVEDTKFAQNVISGATATSGLNRIAALLCASGAGSSTRGRATAGAGSRGSTLSGRVGAQSTSQAFSVGRSGDNGGGSNESKNGGELHCDLEGRESNEDKDGKEARVSHWWSKEGDL